MAFYNFEFHTSLRISVRLLCEIRSFAAKGLSSVFLPPLSLYKWVFLFSARPLTQVFRLWKLLPISTNGRPSLSRTLNPVIFTGQNSKGSRSQISSKQIITIADEAEITASTNVLLIYMSTQRLFCTPCSCSKRSYPDLAHPPRAAILKIWEQNYCLSTSGWTAHALLMANEMPNSNASLVFPFRWTRVTRALRTRLVFTRLKTSLQ